MRSIRTFNLILIAGILLLPACKKNKVEDYTPTPYYELSLQQRLDQATMIMLSTMQEKNLAKEFNDAIAYRLTHFENQDEAISMYEIINDALPYAKHFTSEFRKIYKEKFYSGNYYNADKYKAITERILSNINASSSLVSKSPENYSLAVASSTDDDAIFMASNGVQIYFPYSSNFIGSTALVATTNYPLAEADTVIAYLPPSGARTFPWPFKADDDYAFSHPVYVLNFVNNAERPMEPTPPPPVAVCQDMAYNTLSDVIDDRYIVSVSIPKIKLTRNYRSWVGGSNYLTLNQVYAIPKKFFVDSLHGNLAVDDTNRVVIQSKNILRRDARKGGKWIPFGSTFNGDWRLIQYNNAMIITYKAGWLKTGGGKVNYSIGAGINYDTTSRLWKPSFNLKAGLDISGSMDLKSYWYLDGTDYISRRDMLAHIVGDAFGNGTATQVGESIPFTVRKCGSVLYYFKNRICY